MTIIRVGETFAIRNYDTLALMPNDWVVYDHTFSKVNIWVDEIILKFYRPTG